MRKKGFFLMFLLCCCNFYGEAQKRKDVSGVPVTLNYALPKVSFDIAVEMECTLFLPGPYRQYAQKELGFVPQVSEKKEFWSLKNVEIKSISEIDEKCVYSISSRDSYVPILLSLTPEGLLAGAAAQGVEIPVEANESLLNISLENENPLTSPTLETIYNYNMLKEVLDTNYTMQEFEGEMRKVWDPIVRYETKTEIEHVKDIVKELLRIRSERNKLLAYDVEVADGATLALLLKENAKMEESYLSMFNGVEKRFKIVKHFRATPTATAKNVLAFHFSSAKGATLQKSLDDVSYILQVKESITPGTKQDVGPQTPALYYRIPASVEMALVKEGKEISTFTTLLPQLGTLGQFPLDVIAGEGVRILFHAAYGSIKSVEQGVRIVSEK